MLGDQEAISVLDQDMTLDLSTARTEPRRRASEDDGGFVMPWFALMLIVMVGMAGFGVDVWNWWYTGQQIQRGADAAALGGVPFMPANINQARTTAIDIAARNGYTIGPANVTQGSKPNQLQVTIGQTVANSFTSLLGTTNTTITRSATAEYNEPVQMGSKDPFAGCDPENACTARHWLNIGAPNIDKQTGDRYADYRNCSASWQCSGGINPEYLDSYWFTIDVPAGNAGSDVEFQVYDPEYANGATSCNNGNFAAGANGLTPDQMTALYPDAATRYMQGTSSPNPYCTGDDNTGLGTPQSTVWIVRAPDTTPGDPGNNPIIQTNGPGLSGHCAKQFKGYNQNFSDLLDPSNAAYASDGGQFAASFHRWYTVCRVPTLATGKYFIQVRSAVPLQATPSDMNLSKSEMPPEDVSIAGQNRYALRVVNTGTSTHTAGVQVFAAAHFPIYSNVGNVASSPNFYLARLLPGGGATGRELQLRFFDIGDVGGSGTGCCRTTVTITPPVDATGSATSCSWSFNGGGPMPGGSVGGCTLSGINTANFGGGLVEVDIAVPGDYNCNFASTSGCWFRIQMSYTAGTQANDTTTWDATIGGDPVRLIQ